jgi:hypothetical protein
MVVTRLVREGDGGGGGGGGDASRVSSCMRPFALVWARVGSELPPFVLTGPHSLHSFALILTGPRSPSVARSRSCGLV